MNSTWALKAKYELSKQVRMPKSFQVREQSVHESVSSSVLLKDWEKVQRRRDHGDNGRGGDFFLSVDLIPSYSSFQCQRSNP